MRLSRGGWPAIFGAVAALGIAIGLAGCENNTLSTEPSPGQRELTGTWTGQIADSSGPAQATWQLTQSGASISGTVTLLDAATDFRARGSLSGTLEGSSLRFSVHVAAGGFDAPYGDCTADISGEAQTGDSSIEGTFSGNNSCTGPITSGRVTLVKQP